MNDLYEKIVADHGKMRNWMDKVPGLRGYMDKGDRRTADRMLRDHIASQLEQRRDRFVSLEKKILKMEGGMSMMSETSAAKNKFQIYIDKVKAAAPGYSGFFAAVKVDAAAMDKLYAFDEAQIRYVEEMDAKLDALDAAIGASEGVDDAIQAIYDLAEEAINAFSLRENVLTELNDQYS